MKFSVVIPNLHSPVLDQTLAALATQTWPREQTDVVVVGPDRYGYTARFPFVIHLDPPAAKGASAARNVGIRATEGEVVVFLDADGVPRPDWLARYAAWFSNPGVSVVGGGVEWRWDEPYWTVCDNVSRFYAMAASAPPGERPNLPTLNLAVRRTALEQVGLFNEGFFARIGEDTELCARLRRAGHRVHFDPSIVVEHRQARATFRVVWRTAWQQGYHSVKVDPAYADDAGFPRPLRHPLALRLASPAIAAAVTLNIFRQRPAFRWRPVWPGVYLAKLAWCWGAAERLRSRE